MTEPRRPLPGVAAPPAAGDRAFQAYVAAARGGRTGSWRVLATIVVVFAVQIVVVNFLALGAAAAGPDWARFLGGDWGKTALALAALSITPFALALALAAFHDRPWRGLLSRSGRLEARPLLTGAAMAVCLSAIGLALAAGLGLITIGHAEDYAAPWALIALALILIPLQASGEELVFRGYLLQEIAARSPQAFAWAAAPSAAFALLHLGGEDPDRYYYVVSTFCFGLFAAALVWRSAGLSAAIGVHVANNWIALCLFEPPWGVAGFGPLELRFTPGAQPYSVALDILLLLAAYLALDRLLPRAKL